MLCAFFPLVALWQNSQAVAPVRTEVITPIHNSTFNKGGTAKQRKQGGDPRIVGDMLLFDGASDGNRQVDPQIAVGGGLYSTQRTWGW